MVCEGFMIMADKSKGLASEKVKQLHVREAEEIL
jgi:hypothetical protein